MPSAAAIRQKLPTDLWKSSEHNSMSSVSPSNQIQAYPGNAVFAKTPPKNGNPDFNKSIRKQQSPGNKKKKRSLQRRGSSDDILIQSDSVKSTQTVCVSVSACSDSECGVSYNSTECRDSYAADSFKAPAVNVLPLPPSDWLSFLPKNDDNKTHVMNKASLQLQAFLGIVPAERRRL